MAGVWQLADIEEVQFFAAAALLAIQTEGQSVRPTAQPDHSIEDVSEEEEDIEVDWKSTVTTKSVRSSDGAAHHLLKDKFLDRLAEVFAREKTSPQRAKRTDPKHVAATAWINRSNGSPIIVLVAKNEGLDENDKKIVAKLQTWLRAVAATGRTPSIQKDQLWIGTEASRGLLEYSRGRLEFYISQINQLGSSLDEIAKQAGVNGPIITCLGSLCRNFSWDSSVYQLSDIVSIAYQVRYIWKSPPVMTRLLRTMLLLGRLRAAYECFKTTALCFPEIKEIVLTTPYISLYTVIEPTRARRALEAIVKSSGLKQKTLRTRKAQAYSETSRLHIHAEMQILVSVEKDPHFQPRAHRYIGISRKPCFTCSLFCGNYIKLSMQGDRSPAFRMRESHGKVYPIWSLPQVPVAAPNASLSMATALIQTYRNLTALLKQDPGLRPAIAESSAGVTMGGTSLKNSSRLRQQNLARQRPPVSDKALNVVEDEIKLGAKIKNVKVARFPADGSDPHHVPIDFYAMPEKCDSRIREFGFLFVPDFREYWHECQHDRRLRNIVMENQADERLDGRYWIYWNENTSLPENECIKEMLGLQEIELTRRFWYGDVFIVRFSEQPITYEYDVYDTPLEISTLPALKKIFQRIWEDQSLEEDLEQDSQFKSLQEKVDTDKDIIYQRMTPIQREILKRLPPSTLQYLAITDCDDGAMLDTKIEPSEIEGMVEVSELKMPTALESMGWTGFDSSQL